MTETDWLSSSNPVAMLRLITENPDHASIDCIQDHRKLRLFSVAMWRRHPHILTERNGWQLVEVGERFADGLATDEEVRKVRAAHGIDWDGGTMTYEAWVIQACRHWVGALTPPKNRESEKVAVANAVREVFGNPFRPVTIDPQWLTWNDGTIPRLAESIYQERAWDRLPILADALEEAGCQGERCRSCINGDSMVTAFKKCFQCGGRGWKDHPVLAHLRSPDPHVRGCWALDLLTGRK